MTDRQTTNRQIIVSELSKGTSNPDNSAMTQTEIPTPAVGQVLQRVLVGIFDAFNRSRTQCVRAQ